MNRDDRLASSAERDWQNAMPYARAKDVYEELVVQIDDGRSDNAREIALDALTSAFSDESDDFIKPIVDVVLNFELGGQFGGDRVQVLLDTRTLLSLNKAISLLRRGESRVDVRVNGDSLHDRSTQRLTITDHLVFFYEESSCYLMMHKHALHDLIVIQVVK